MALAIGEAAGRYGHLLYPLTLHPPVVTLSRYMVEKGKLPVVSRACDLS